MAIIKCKMCGGDMELNTDQRCGTCEYCGSTMTLPKVDDEQRAAAFNRGNHFRRIGEFDKALTVYEHIVQEDEADAEAHWCCALCRFGIEYVKDPASGVYIPTCHRASFDSFLEDVDYKAALQYADAVARIQYQKDGEKIAEIQRNILSVSQKESPFDIFICYKESDEHGHRTIDSTLAQEIYYQLTEAGYRVFFSRITLEDKVGQEYEPYIFAALHSAKVMIVVGTKAEYLNAIWVKNEWGRYLALMKEDRKKLLIPCYRDMDPYDMPEQLSVLQSYDMSKIGFIQDLTRGISKVLNKEEKQTVRETVVVQSEGRANVDALLKRGYMALEDGEWKKADEFFEQVLNYNAECSEAYWGKFLALNNERTTATFINNRIQKIESENPKVEKLEEQEDEKFIEEMVDQYYIQDYLSVYTIKEKLYFDLRYSSTKSYRQQKLEEEIAFWDSNKLYQRAVAFASAPFATEINTAKEMIISLLQKKLDNAIAEDAENVARIKEEYRKHLNKIKTELNINYPTLLKRQEEDRIAAQKKEEERRISLQKEIERKQSLIAARAAKVKKIATISGIVAAIVIVGIVVSTQIIIPHNKYVAAEELLEQGDKIRAAIEFGEISGYRDAFERSISLRDGLNSTFSTGYKFTVAVHNDGTAVGIGENKDGQINVSDWEDIVSVSCGARHTVGLKADGTVVAVGNNEFGQCEVSDWKNIVAVDCAVNHTIGLRADGTVVATGNNNFGQINVSDWKNIVAVSTGSRNTVGLKSDGTVVVAGTNTAGQCETLDWKDVIAISQNENTVIGLKSDGTVMATGYNGNGQSNISDWTDIVAISANDANIIGLKSDGTVVACGDNEYGQCNVTNWKNIVAISANTTHTVGLKSDGTVVAVGYNGYGKCDVSDWLDIVAIYANDTYTVGLRSDGTLVAVGDNEEGQCDVSNWKNIKLP